MERWAGNPHYSSPLYVATVGNQTRGLPSLDSQPFFTRYIHRYLASGRRAPVGAHPGYSKLAGRFVCIQSPYVGYLVVLRMNFDWRASRKSRGAGL